MRIRSHMSSLHWRLPVLILTLLALISVAFMWTAYREMQRALRVVGDERVHNAAAQLAGLLAQSASARAADSRRLAAEPAIRRFVATGENPEAALLVLRAMGQRNPQAQLSLNARGAGAPIHLTSDNVTLDRSPAGSVAPPDSKIAGVGRLRLEDGHVSYRTITFIPPLAGAADRDGFVSIDRPLNSSPGSAPLIERLIGTGASLKFGNASGDLWTDLSKPVVAPPAVPSGAATVAYTDAAGNRRLGTAVPIAATPWNVWVEFSENELTQPARILVRHMVPWTAGLILLGVVAVWLLSARITKPLEHLADAADAIASGNYSRRVSVTGDDEIGRLGSAFNVMAVRVAESLEALDARVQERTRELTHSREEVDQFLSMSLDLLCIADFEGRFTRVNPAWESVLGWTPAELTAIPYLSLVHPDDVASTSAQAARLAEGSGAVNFENRYRGKDGTYRWFSWNAAASRERRLTYAVARDVTDEKRAARELQQYAAELTVANRELEAFSYSVSHDLRAPLRSVDGFSQALLEDCGDRLGADGKEHLRRIRSAAQHMGQLIDDLLKLARVTRADLRFETIDLSAMAQSALVTLAEGDQGRTVEWHVHPGLQVHGDTRLMRIAVENLLGNAWKFTSKCAAPKIEFGSRANGGDKPEYYVKDNGAGFDPTYSQKLFGAFQRLHHASDYPGTGIGLATVQRIVARHGGRVHAEGAVGNGAMFSFTLQPDDTYEPVTYRAD
jgi:PAS domain S-box-containing protein